MRPCEVCGGIVINSAGFCAQCGNPRTQSARLAMGSATGPPSPQSVPPYTQPTVAPVARQRGLTVPLIALSVLLAVLVIGIVVVVVVKNIGGAAAGDECVVGRWRVTAHTETVPVDDVGVTTFTGSGQEFRLDSDGTGHTDYAGGTDFTGTVNGQTVTLTVRGVVTYRFVADDGTFSLRDIGSQASAQTTVDDRPSSTPKPFRLPTDPATYECSGDALTMRTSFYETRLARLD